MRIDAQPLGTNINIQISYSYDSYNIYLDGKLVNSTVFSFELTKSDMACKIADEVLDLILTEGDKKIEDGNKTQADK